MCGRIFVKPTSKTSELLNVFRITDGKPLSNLYNLAPTERVPLILALGADFQLEMARWWLHPSWSKTPPATQYATFNARIESVTSSPSFRGAIKTQRGIIPASGFVEWKTIEDPKNPKKTIKIPYFIESEKQELAMAAVWDLWNDEVLSCAIITQPADRFFSQYHDRMPLTLTYEEALTWMDHSLDHKELVEHFKGKTLPLHVREVSPAINNARNKSDVEFVS